MNILSTIGGAAGATLRRYRHFMVAVELSLWPMIFAFRRREEDGVQVRAVHIGPLFLACQWGLGVGESRTIRSEQAEDAS